MKVSELRTAQEVAREDKRRHPVRVRFWLAAYWLEERLLRR